MTWTKPWPAPGSATYPAESLEAITEIRDAIDQGGGGGGGDVAGDTHAASAKASPVDADELPLVDSAGSWVLKKLTWSALKTAVQTYTDTLYAALGHTHAQADITDLASDLAGKQGADADLTAIAGLSPSNNDVIQRKSGAWVNRTPAQLKTDLALAKGDVGLGNVDNTSDATKNGAVATLANKTLITPTIGNLTNAQHDHTNEAGGGQLTDAALSAPVGITKGGTGTTTAANAIKALLPSQSGQSGKVLGTDGTDASWVTPSGGGGKPQLRGVLQSGAYYRAYFDDWTKDLGGMDAHPNRLYIAPSQLGGRGPIDRVVIRAVANLSNQSFKLGYYTENEDGSLTLVKDFGTASLGTTNDTDIALTVSPTWSAPDGFGWFGVLNASGGYATIGICFGSPAYTDVFGMVGPWNGNGSGVRWYNAGASSLPASVPKANNASWIRDDGGYNEKVPFVAVRGA